MPDYPMTLLRQDRSTRRMVINAFVSGAAASMFWWWVSVDGGWFDKAGAIVFSVQCIWTVYHLMARKTVGKIHEDSLSDLGLYRRHAFRFSEIQWINVDLNEENRLGGGICWRPEGTAKDKYVALSKALIGIEGLRKIQEAIISARPDIPQSAPQHVKKNGESPA